MRNESHFRQKWLSLRIPWDFRLVPLLDLQAIDQVTLNGKAPLQLSGPTREIAGKAARYEVILLT